MKKKNSRSQSEQTFRQTVLNKATSEQIKIPELITILSVSLALWYTLLNFILNFPENSENPVTIFGLCIAHYLNATIILSCALILYFKTVSLTNSNNRSQNTLSKVKEKCSRFLNVGWLPTITFSIIQYILLTLAFESASDCWLTIVFFVSALITTSIFLVLLNIRIKDLLKYLNSNKLDGYKILKIVLSFFVYCITMIFIFSSVEYRLDKEYYRNEEKPVISITPKGYVFKPIITSITYNNLRIDVTNKTTSSHIEIDPHHVKRNGGYILITYKTQILQMSKKLPIIVSFLEEIN